MDEEKEIKQFAKDLERCQVYADIGGYQTDFMETARSLCYEGYRFADEVRKETAKEILSYLKAVQERDELRNFDLDILSVEYGVEVDE